MKRKSALIKEIILDLKEIKLENFTLFKINKVNLLIKLLK